MKEQLKALEGGALVILLRQELVRLQSVAGQVRRDLGELTRALEGGASLPPWLAAIHGALAMASPPPAWVAASWPAADLGSWASEMQARGEQLSAWLEGGRPASFWLGGLFNPRGLLTAAKQEVVRAKGWALDSSALSITLRRSMRDAVKKAPDEGVYVHGLSLEGAQWDRKENVLAESRPKVLFQEVPVVHITAAAPGAAGLGKDTYLCPVYLSNRRGAGEHVMDLPLRTPTGVGADTWVLRGVAAYLRRSD
mmetsp:Transcript_24425/g.77102  ORF Transcript_24425/g.77102 Transcript_24425/m.77102 type:complete len:253 (-) Transcript_24425:1511-2269(-)